MERSDSMASEIASVLDPAFLEDVHDIPIEAIRERRDKANRIENLLSYLRRVLQARIDLLQPDALSQTGSEEVFVALSKALTDTRAPAPSSARWIEVELGVDDLRQADAWLEGQFGIDVEMSLEFAHGEPAQEYLKLLQSAERGISELRHKLHAVQEVMSSDIIERYRRGDASVEALLEGHKG